MEEIELEELGDESLRQISSFLSTGVELETSQRNISRSYTTNQDLLKHSKRERAKEDSRQIMIGSQEPTLISSMKSKRVTDHHRLKQRSVYFKQDIS